MKKGSQPPQKKKGVTPVVLVDDSQQLSNTVIISKMINQKQNSSNKSSFNGFSGGFKYRPEEKNNQSLESNKPKLNPSQLDRVTVYDEFGIINDSIGKKKYRQNSNEAQNRLETANPSRPISESNPWKKQFPIAQNNFMDSDHYQMSTAKQREQTALHVKSSLQVINLENIEAKLQAHRQSMKPIQEQYNQIKGKSFVKDGSPTRQQLNFRQDIDKQFKESQPSKLYQLIKEKQEKMQRPQQEVVLEQLWQQRKKKDPKLAEYDFKYQQFLVEKEAKKLIGDVVKTNLFTWDKYAMQQDLQQRKKVRKNKSKEKCYGEAIESKVLEKVYGKTDGSPSKVEHGEQVQMGQVNLKQRIASKDDKFIGKFIMAEIDVDKRGTISKDQLVDYLSSKDHLIKGYHIDLKWLHTDLDSFQTKRKGMLNKGEVIQFLATLDSLHHPEIVLKDAKIAETSQIPKKSKQQSKMMTSYFGEYLSRFENIFKMIDVNDDRLIKREEFIENIYLDSDCSKILDKTVIKLNVIDKSITFRQILTFILDDYRKEKNEKIKKSKQYITFQKFKEYFQLPQCLDLKMFEKSQNEKLQKQKPSTQIDLFDIEEEYLQILKDLFDMIPRVYQEYIISNDFMAIALKDPQVLAISDQMCRIQSYQTNLPVESIKSTLLRMAKQCDQYVTWDLLKTYFSRRGRPLDWNLELIQKKKEIRQSKLKDIASSKLQGIKTEQDGEKKRLMSETIKTKTMKMSSVEKYTVPQPFNITDERGKSAIKSKELSSQQKQIEEMKKKFKAKPVNKDILKSNPDLIQGKLPQKSEKPSYNYENYENDRIERVLKKAQQQFEQKQLFMEIMRQSEVKAKNINIDLKKKLDTVMQQKKKKIEKSKPKPTKPQVSENLYSDPKVAEAKKLEDVKKKKKKIQEIAEMMQRTKKQNKQKLDKKQRKQRLDDEKKKKEEDKRKQKQKLQQNSFQPTINKRQLTNEQRSEIEKLKEEKDRKKQEEIKKLLQTKELQKRKRDEIHDKIMEDKRQRRKQQYLLLQTLTDDQILNKLEDDEFFQKLLLEQGDRAAFRKEYDFKGKTKKAIKDFYKGFAARERATMEAEERRIGEEKRKNKEQKQQKLIENGVKKQRKKYQDVESPLNLQTQFYRSKALRRYRVLIENENKGEEDKKVPQEFDSYLVNEKYSKSELLQQKEIFKKENK